MEQRKAKDVALVLSGGGAKGYAHIGAIQAIQETGARITSIAGTSMGALVGGFLAAGKLEEGTEWLRMMDKKKMFNLLDLKNFSKRGIIDGQYLMDELYKILGHVLIEDLPIPYCAIAANLYTGKEKVLDSGELVKAIRASISLPGAFIPYEMTHGCHYVDGGLVNGIPIDRVKRKDGDVVIAINLDNYGKVSNPEDIIDDPLKSKKTKEFKHSFPSFQDLKEFKMKELIYKIKASSYRHIPIRIFAPKDNILEIFLKSLDVSLKHNKELMIRATRPDIYANVELKEFGTLDFNCFDQIKEKGYQVMKHRLELRGDKLYKKTYNKIPR